MQLKFTIEEYTWLGRRLNRLTQALQGRDKATANLIKETAAKFTGERVADSEGLYTVGIQRRHLRLLQEVQGMTVKAIKEATIKELESRIKEGKGDTARYQEKLSEAKTLLAGAEVLLAKIEARL